MKPETTTCNRLSLQTASLHRLESYQRKLLAQSTTEKKSKNPGTSKGGR